MALLVINGELVHSGEIGPSWRGARAIGDWRRTWARFDREVAADELGCYMAGMTTFRPARQTNAVARER